MKPKHLVRVRKYNRHPGLALQGVSTRSWWADCRCGWYIGSDDKHDAQRLGDKHVATHEGRS